jgi:hypothetical protein
VQVAEIAADTRLKVAELDTDRDTKYNQSLAERDRQQAEYLDRKLEAEYNLRLLEYANRRQITLDNAKKEMAKVAMTLRTQVALAKDKNATGPQVANAAAEPPGRARNGRAFPE